MVLRSADTSLHSPSPLEAASGKADRHFYVFTMSPDVRLQRLEMIASEQAAGYQEAISITRKLILLSSCSKAEDRFAITLANV